MAFKTTRRLRGGFILGAVVLLLSTPISLPPENTPVQTTLLANAAAPPARDGLTSMASAKRTRAEVQERYWSMYGSGLDQIPQDSSNVAACEPGDLRSSDRLVQKRALNFMRSLNGLSPIRVNNYEANERAQAAALIMAANRQLSHHPDSSWTCWTPMGERGAATSNIGIGPGLSGAEWVEIYMDDPGDNNTAVGHRRWLQLPDLDAMGVGTVTSPDGTTGSALTIMEVRRNRTAPNPPWVAWPAPGHFPNTLSTQRWSLSSGYDFAEFKKARVRVTDTKTGRIIPVRLHPVKYGYGKPTLAWEMDEFDPNSTFSVKVSNIRVKTGRVSHTYKVKMFTPVR